MDEQLNRSPRPRDSDLVRWLRRSFFALSVAAFLLFCVLVGAGGGILLALEDDLPSLAPLEDYNSAEWHLPTKVYSRRGKLIGSFYEQRRELIDVESIPPSMIQAVIAIEDNRFFQHQGLDFRGIARAAIRNFLAGRIVEGGSTITQQLAKVLFLKPEQTLLRKVKEALLALRIERHYTKKQILERYFNKIYFGEGAYGVETAARIYFGKSARDLTVAEAALLAALPKAPSYYSPINNPEEARQRHWLVLKSMVEAGYLEGERARRQFLSFWRDYSKELHRKAERQQDRIREAPWFVEHVRKRLLDKYGSEVVYQGGLTVKTTVDLKLQRRLQQKLNDYLLERNIEMGNLADTASTIPRQPRSDLVQGAVQVKDPRTGKILAMIGGHDWNVDNQYNRAVQAHRQPGSAFKPILYTAALTEDFTLASRLQDRPLVFNTPQGEWVPRNYSKKYHGRVTLRNALVHSMNVATVDLMKEIGPEKVISYARKLGIRSELMPHLSLALGGLRKGVSLAELTDVYSVFANGGVRTKSVYIREVLDREDNLLERNFAHRREVISPQVAFLVTSLLQRVVNEGTGQAIGRSFDRPIAGKTGTTNKYRDAGFIGYTPNIVMGSWFGYDTNNRSLGENMTGGVLAGEFWRRAAPVIFEGRPPRTFSVPPGISYESIDPTTGYRATPQCPRTSREPFITGTEPTRLCPVHQEGTWS